MSRFGLAPLGLRFESQNMFSATFRTSKIVVLIAAFVDKDYDQQYLRTAAVRIIAAAAPPPPPPVLLPNHRTPLYLPPRLNSRRVVDNTCLNTVRPPDHVQMSDVYITDTQHTWYNPAGERTSRIKSCRGERRGSSYYYGGPYLVPGTWY